MLSIDVLISVKDTRIVRIKEALPDEIPGVKYYICYQYTDEKYLKLIPEALENYPDVTLIKSREVGLSKSRNTILDRATADLIYFVDDDTQIIPYAIENIRKVFEQHQDVDIAFFQAQSYAGKPLREYSLKEKNISSFHDILRSSTNEMVCRREKVQGNLSFNTHFGLGSGMFVCYEQQVFLQEALKHHLKLRYFPLPIIKTSAIYKTRLIGVDKHVQRALGGLLGYVYKARSPLKACWYASKISGKNVLDYLAVLKILLQGIVLERRNRKD